MRLAFKGNRNEGDMSKIVPSGYTLILLSISGAGGHRVWVSPCHRRN